jgi:hypothetical protein
MHRAIDFPSAPLKLLVWGTCSTPRVGEIRRGERSFAECARTCFCCSASAAAIYKNLYSHTPRIRFSLSRSLRQFINQVWTTAGSRCLSNIMCAASQSTELLNSNKHKTLRKCAENRRPLRSGYFRKALARKSRTALRSSWKREKSLRTPSSDWETLNSARHRKREVQCTG